MLTDLMQKQGPKKPLPTVSDYSPGPQQSIRQ
jgi:hypothetical protein